LDKENNKKAENLNDTEKVSLTEDKTETEKTEATGKNGANSAQAQAQVGEGCAHDQSTQVKEADSAEGAQASESEGAGKQTAPLDDSSVQEQRKCWEEQIAKLKNELALQSEEARKKHDLYIRALAEMENLKKRTAREKEEFMQFANIGFIKKLLPIIDDFERALIKSKDAKDIESVYKGIELIYKRLNQLLTDEGIQTIECVGKPFDPQYHQPLMMEKSDEYPENTVIEELQKGYIFKNRLIRPSLVKVSQ